MSGGLLRRETGYHIDTATDLDTQCVRYSDGVDGDVWLRRFGNLTSKVLNGTTTTIGVTATTNRLSSASYDGNGNMTSGAGGTLTYDDSSRMSSFGPYRVAWSSTATRRTISEGTV